MKTRFAKGKNMNTMNRLGMVLIAALTLTMASCMKNSSYPSAATTQGSGTKPPPNTLIISNFAFTPSDITVARGTSITWTNNDAATHSATADGGQWDTGSITTGTSVAKTFNTPGTFPYHCSQHPMMTGTVTVQ